MIDKIIDPNMAMNAYAKGQSIAKASSVTDEGGETGEAGSAGGLSFSSFLKDKAHDVLDTLKAGETTSAKAITGEAGVADVVQAVTEAEITLETVVAVRDRMISAYQEIMRMPI